MDDNRRHPSLRLPGYDYYQGGGYFTTICLQNRACLFGEVLNGAMKLNAIGHKIRDTWISLPQRFSTCQLDEFVIMPNHLHGILLIGGAHDTSLSSIIGAFKSLSTREYIRGVREQNWPAFDGILWQRGYYDHVIRNDKDLDRIRQYIVENPARWSDDEENPNR